MYPKSMDTKFQDFFEFNGYITDTLLHALRRKTKKELERVRKGLNEIKPCNYKELMVEIERARKS